jgi:hypothetical protein
LGLATSHLRFKLENMKNAVSFQTKIAINS